LRTYLGFEAVDIPDDLLGNRDLNAKSDGAKETSMNNRPFFQLSTSISVSDAARRRVEKKKNWSRPRQPEKQHHRDNCFGVLPTAVILIVAAAVVLAKPQNVLGAPGNEAPQNRFKSTVRSKLLMAEGGQEHEVEAEAVIEYAWERDGKRRTLVFNEMSARTVFDGTERENTTMSRSGFEDITRRKKITLEQAPDQLRKLLTDLFGKPVCEVELDAIGKELKRTFIAEPGAAQIIDDGGMIANALLFHPGYPPDSPEWQAHMEIGTGQKGLASGNVTYTKVPGGKAFQLVKVSGTLATDGVRAPKGLKYVVNGEQTYDISRSEWVAGKLNMGVTIDYPDKGVNGQGQMVCTFEMLPVKN
jgi:hypothetical protein